MPAQWLSAVPSVSEICFLCTQGPLGLLAGEDTWDARGLAWESSCSVHSASAKEMGTLGQRGRGWGWGRAVSSGRLFRQQHPRGWQ